MPVPLSDWATTSRLPRAKIAGIALCCNSDGVSKPYAYIPLNNGGRSPTKGWSSKRGNNRHKIRRTRNDIRLLHPREYRRWCAISSSPLKPHGTRLKTLASNESRKGPLSQSDFDTIIDNNSEYNAELPTKTKCLVITVIYRPNGDRFAMQPSALVRRRKSRRKITNAPSTRKL